jgi:hypothetical protein
VRRGLGVEDDETEVGFRWVWVAATWIARIDLDLDEDDLWHGPPLLTV